MSNVKFTIAVSQSNSTITLTDNGTNWIRPGDNVPGSLDIYFRGEDKTSYVVKRNVVSPVEIAAFMGSGLVLYFTELFAATIPSDGFYQVDIIADEGETLQMLCDKMAVGFTYEVAELIHNNMLGVNVPVDDLQTSLTLGMMPQCLELLQTLSTEAVYSYDRENKWRKIYNYLTIVVNDLTY